MLNKYFLNERTVNVSFWACYTLSVTTDFFFNEFELYDLEHYLHVLTFS